MKTSNSISVVFMALVMLSSAVNAGEPPVEKKYILHPVCDSHIDMNWRWDWSETVETFRQTWERMLKRMDEHPWFVFVQSQPALTATFHVPYAAKERPANGQEVPAIQWFDVSNENVGISLLNNVKYGGSVDGSTLAISLLRNPHAPDPWPDTGRHEFTYSLYPHAGNWKAARSMRHGAQLNQPLHGYVKQQNGAGKLPPAFSLVKVAAWVKVDPSAKSPSWVAGQGDNYGLVVNRYDDDGVFFYFYNGSEWLGVGSGDVGIRDGKWHHVAGVFDDAANSLYVYKDGVKVGSERTKGRIDYRLGKGFTIGSMQGERRFLGAIDDVRVYDHVLSQAEMDQVAMVASTRAVAPNETAGKGAPTGVTFHKDTLFRSDGSGDNWRPAWAADDSQIIPMCDGSWLGIKGYHNHLYRIIGGPDDFVRKDIPNYPDYSGGPGSWFGYGVVNVDGVIYSAVSKTPGPSWSGPFRGIKMLKSKDNGNTWYRVDRNGNERKIGPRDDARNEVNPKEMFFLEEFGLPHQKQEAYPFSYVDFVKCGKDNRAAKDNYLYIYSPEGAQAHKLLLARVPKEKLGVRSAWEYFVKYKDSQPIWTADLRKRGYAYIYPEKSQDGNCFGWYSWIPSVVWNEGLGLYIMVNGGTYGGPKMTSSDSDYYDAWMHTRTGSLGFWYSKKPYGPWHQFFYTDYWTVDAPKNRTYQPSLSPKWISKDGREMVLIWSDAMENKKGQSHTVNYTWNQMKIEIRTQ